MVFLNLQNIDKTTREDIIGSIVTLIEIVPERELKIIEKALTGTENLTFTVVKKMTDLSGPQADCLASFLRNLHIGKSELLLCLEVAKAARNHAKQNTDKCDLIWTGPIQFPIPARSTLGVIKEMINEANKSVTIVGYRIEDYAEPIISALYLAAKRNVTVRLVIDKAKKQLSIFRKIWIDWELPEFYYREPTEDDPMSSIHAKMIIVDSNILLITSANLTYHGLSSNLEIGVKIRGKTARGAERLVDTLIGSKHLVRA